MKRVTLTLLLLTAVASTSYADDWGAIELQGRTVEPGSKARFPFIPDQSFEATYLNMPVFVARGAEPGPTLCITAGIHGDELNGVEVARRAFSEVDTESMRGTLIALPAINAEGVRTGNRYLSDRRDLNRAFPGRAGGSVASLIAYSVFEVVQSCDALVDLHTASNNRTNLPQIRADISDPEIRELAVHFGLGIVVAGKGPDGSLRREAAKAGIPAIIYEAGEPYRFQEHEVERGVEGVRNVMAHLDMTDRADVEIPDTRVYERTRWIRARTGQGGFFFPSAGLGDIVEAGQRLGRIVDPLTDESFDVVSTIPGEVVGMAVPQPVLSGYALFHVAWHTND
ncbi:MAG: succinylglutamate desuccinylase/aspartoacylase family protein [Woeseiaceae bacterium]|nr:succinylglutamate desuccinylase/aspartoacylase family protein [Woeseiaceae bacterium]